MKTEITLSKAIFRCIGFITLFFMATAPSSIAQCDVEGGMLFGGPFGFCIDGEEDFVSDVGVGDNSAPINQWVITDTAGEILGLPDDPTMVNFDEAGSGICLIWNLAYEDPITGLETGNNVADIMGCFDFSDSIVVNRFEPIGGKIEGGPFEFCVDGNVDNVSGITLTGNVGTSSQWVVTDGNGTILGLPSMPGDVNFDEPGPGVCFIYHLSVGGNINGLAMGANIFNLDGCYDISNAIAVVRTNRGAPCDAECDAVGGVLESDPFSFCVDGEADMVSGIGLSGNMGSTNTWVITDPEGNILGLPPMPGAVDFDEAGAGVCLIWNIAHEDDLEGLMVDNNIFEHLTGCFSLSNPIIVTRTEPIGGDLEGGPFTFCVDGEADMVSGIELTGNQGANSQWVITDTEGLILGLPPMPGVVNFEDAGPGVCLIWHLSYEDGLDGLGMGANVGALTGCYSFSDSVVVTRNEADGGILSGGPFDFCVDGVEDNVSGISLVGNTGSNSGWIVTDVAGKILGLPPMPGVVDFDEAGPGVCLIWHISYEDGLEGLAMDNNVSDLVGCFDISNSVTVNRTQPLGGVLEGGPFEFCIDTEPDFVSGITLTGAEGQNMGWVVTNEQGSILGLPGDITGVDFNAAGEGICQIWHIAYEDGLTGLAANGNLSLLMGCYNLSNEITVVRTSNGAACDDSCGIEGGTLEGGPFDFCVDGEADMVSGITLEGNTGTFNQWIVTDVDGNILGLPPMPGAVDFDEAGPGVCLIYNLTYEDGLIGLNTESNIFDDLEGCFSLSNSITVTRTEPLGGTLEGGPFNFCVDGEADNVSGITLTGNEGTNSAWVITDTEGNILGLPPMPGVVNFDEAGPGICLIWNISYELGLEGLEVDSNTGDLVGCYAFSNSIEVVRSQPAGGTLEGGPFEFCVDGEADNVSGITLSGNTGENNAWVITDPEGNILGLPPMPGVVNFDEAGPGVCLIWNIAYSDGLTGLEVDQNVSGLMGCYSLSNSIEVVRNQVDGGTLEGGPFEFCVDGEADNVSGITLSGNMGDNLAWVITDTEGNILGIPAMPGLVNFDEAGPGVCLIWSISFSDGLTGLALDENVNDLQGCYAFSNSVEVVRNEPAGGTLEGGPFEFCVDGVEDNVSGITLTGNDGKNNAWVITDPEGNILGLPPMPGVVNFDEAGPGVCLIWNIAYEDGLTGLAMDNNVADLEGCFAFSNSIEVVRTTPEGGELVGGPYEFCINGQDDFVTDLGLTGASGPLTQWIVTDENGNILGLPPSPDAVNFDEAGVGNCYIWHLSYEEGITGLEMGLNAAELQGCFDLSNFIEVVRVVTGENCSVATEDELLQDFRMYPNPARDFVHLELGNEDAGNFRLSLTDTYGKLINTRNISATTKTLDLDVSIYTPGIYFLTLNNEKASRSFRLVIMK